MSVFISSINSGALREIILLTTETFNGIFPNALCHIQGKSSGQVGLRGTADLLLVIKVDDTARWNEVYYDDHQAVLDISRYSKRDNKHVVTHTKLRELADLRLTG